MILSPFSIRAALSLVAEGAEEGTFDDLQKNLYLPKSKQAIADNYKSTFQSLVKSGDAAVTLDLANKIYVQEGYTIKPAFKSVAVESFGSEVEAANFGDNVKSAKAINTWVEEKTHDKIKDLISPDSLDSDSRVVIVSAIYFKGNWANKFDSKLTKKDEFWVSATESKQVDYMIQKNDFYYGQFPQLDATILKLNYNNSDISFWILLPNQRDGLAALEGKLETVNWNELNDGLFKTEVNVKIPKFKIESEFKLKEALEEVSDFDGVVEEEGGVGKALSNRIDNIVPVFSLFPASFGQHLLQRCQLQGTPGHHRTASCCRCCPQGIHRSQ